MEQLASYLESHNLTQAAFAERVGATQPYISKLLSGGRTHPSIALALRIERVTGGAVPITAWVHREEFAGASVE